MAFKRPEWGQVPHERSQWSIMDAAEVPVGPAR
ncbi:hypothetical protein YWIDRAFT_00560 [Streptomyces sp. SceaMP-e96]|nr:hypothetical protein YWIDRAFT_00560 [Streptomyces sp. SceaMP-e96]